MKKPFSKTVVVLTSGVLFFVMALAAFSFELMILRQQGDQLKDAVRSAALAEVNRKNSIELSKLRAETVGEREQVASFVLTQDTLIDFISEIEQVAKQQQLDFVTKSITPVELDDDLFDEVSIGVDFEGSQNQVLKMISVIETLPYHGYISSVNLNKSGSQWRADVIMRLTVITYDQ